MRSRWRHVAELALFVAVGPAMGCNTGRPGNATSSTDTTAATPLADASVVRFDAMAADVGPADDSIIPSRVEDSARLRDAGMGVEVVGLDTAAARDVGRDQSASPTDGVLKPPTSDIVLDCSQYQGLVHPLFSDNAVLQREVAVPVWGCTTPGAAVSVSLADKTASGTADATGLWQVRLPAMPAGGPFTLNVTGPTSVKRSNVYVGDVWLCSGQSNMEWRADLSTNASPVLAAALKETDVHYFFVPHETDRGLPEPSHLFDSGAWPQTSWLPPSTNTVNRFSAVCLFFAHTLHARTKVPYGLIDASYGGTTIQMWNSIEVMAAHKGIADAQSQAEIEQVLAGTTPAGTGPFVSSLFSSMISPLAPYALRGVVWYQGENNRATATTYATFLNGMITDWRVRFGISFPVIVVQLPRMPASAPADSTALVREAQLCVAQTTPNTGLAVTIDTGSATTMHPADKRDVGDRVAALADGLVYGQSTTYTGPLYKSMTVEGGKIRIAFDFVGDGLMVGQKTPLEPVLEIPTGTLAGFTIAGGDGKFVPATAVIDGKTVVVSSPNVTTPSHVRYGWDAAPSCNLYNKASLPASPFRTDHP